MRDVVSEYRQTRGALWAPARPVEVRLLACELVGRPDVREAFDVSAACGAATADLDPLVRSRAAARCSEAGLLDEGGIAALAEDPHWAVRTRLATGLAGLADRRQACRWLERLRRDPHATVATAAAGAFADCPSRAAEQSR